MARADCVRDCSMENFSMLMGDDAGLRRAIIEPNALRATGLCPIILNSRPPTLKESAMRRVRS
jgi:hypothetical protein